MVGRRAVVLVSTVALLGCSANPAAQPRASHSASRTGSASPSAVPRSTAPALRTPSAQDLPTPATSTTTATATVTPSAAPADDPAVAAPFTGTTQALVQDPTGGPFGVRLARVARQSGYDRVVIELAGQAAGAPGWRVSYVAAPTSDGSGNPIAMRGRYYLHVGVLGVGYPSDTGVPSPAMRRIVPPDSTVIDEVVLDNVFEGVYTSYIGLSAKRPYRVFALSNPSRIVVDIRHS